MLAPLNDFVTGKMLVLIVSRITCGAFKPSLASMGIILDEFMLIALEGVEGERPSPIRFHSISYEARA